MMPRGATSRNGANRVGGIDEDVEEQRRILARIQQERDDHELALRIQRENYGAPTPQRRRQNNAAARRGQRDPLRPPPMMRASNYVRPASSRPPQGATNPSRSGGPIRRNGTATTSNRGRRPAAQNGRERAPRRNTTAPVLSFQGDRVFARQGNMSVDVTSSVHFPSDDEDDDYMERESDGSPSDDDIEVEEVIPAPPRRASRGGAVTRGRSSQRGRGGRRPAVSGNYIQMLLHNVLQPDRGRSPDYEVSDDDEDDDDDSGSNSSNGSDGSEVDDDLDETDLIGDQDGVIEVSSDSEDELEAGPIHADGNHINQPIFEEDREMYNRELDLYHNDNEYRVPPPKVQLFKGKPMEPDATWGDCTMCSNSPVKPQGCTKCLQFLGCADCVVRWHAARLDSVEGPSCPLCRAEWGSRPSVLLMKTIDKRREKENKATSSSAGSTSSSSSS